MENSPRKSAKSHKGRAVEPEGNPDFGDVGGPRLGAGDHPRRVRREDRIHEEGERDHSSDERNPAGNTRQNASNHGPLRTPKAPVEVGPPSLATPPPGNLLAVANGRAHRW
jgi:hypothetical protein